MRCSMKIPSFRLINKSKRLTNTKPNVGQRKTTAKHEGSDTSSVTSSSSLPGLCKVNNDDNLGHPVIKSKDDDKKTNKKIQKSVQFAKKRNRMSIDSCHDMSPEEKANIWYNRSELRLMKEYVQTSAMDDACCTVELASYYVDAYMQARYLTTTMDNTMDDSASSFVLNDPDAIAVHAEDACAWTCQESNDDGHCVRGLEIWGKECGVDYIQKERGDVAKEARDVVLSTTTTTTKSNDRGLMSVDKRKKESATCSTKNDIIISREYSEVSFSAVIFARMMGEADYVAALHSARD